jgi:hypothetical protein
LSKKNFLDVASEALAEYKYVGPDQRADLAIAAEFESKRNLKVIAKRN